MTKWVTYWQGRPCHLYFDLEFNTLANAGVNGEAMVDTLLSITSSALLDVFSLQYESSWTLELDSSTKGTQTSHFKLLVLQQFKEEITLEQV